MSAAGDSATIEADPSPIARPPAGPWFVPAMIVVLCAAWAVCAVLSNGHGAVHEDMAEAYSWGRHFEWGYYKHPPFWAWIAGLWFLVWPHTTWAFAALSAVNIGVGLWGAWLLIGRFASGDRRLAGFALMLLTPLYCFLAFTYNANMIFVSLWPWTAYSLVRSLDERKLGYAVLFGLLAAACVLSKYFAGVLLVACLAAALVHPDRKAYFRSPAPYVSIAAGAPFVAAHLWWLVATGFLPFHYLSGEAGLTLGYSLATALKMFTGDIAYHLIIIALLLWAGRSGLAGLGGRVARLVKQPRFRLLAILALGPMCIAPIVGIMLRMKVSTAWTIGVLPLMPLLLLDVFDPPQPRRLFQVSVVLALIVAAVAIAVSPYAAAGKLRQRDKVVIEPRLELAAEATQLWRARTGTPLAFVSGTHRYAGAVVFYSPDQPVQFVDFNFRYAPWVDPGELKRRGLLAVCLSDDKLCLDRAAGFATAETTLTPVRLAHRVGREMAPPVDFIIVMTPPQA
jgi:4-amino-4-deoxy-L-arabinose transferase-like glycosyltransferase